MRNIKTYEFEWVKGFKLLIKPFVILVAFVITPIIYPLIITWVKNDLAKHGLEISDFIDKKPRQ